MLKKNHNSFFINFVKGKGKCYKQKIPKSELFKQRKTNTVTEIQGSAQKKYLQGHCFTLNNDSKTTNGSDCSCFDLAQIIHSAAKSQFSYIYQN